MVSMDSPQSSSIETPPPAFLPESSPISIDQDMVTPNQSKSISARTWLWLGAVVVSLCLLVATLITQNPNVMIMTILAAFVTLAIPGSLRQLVSNVRSVPSIFSASSVVDDVSTANRVGYLFVLGSLITAILGAIPFAPAANIDQNAYLGEGFALLLLVGGLLAVGMLLLRNQLPTFARPIVNASVNLGEIRILRALLGVLGLVILVEINTGRFEVALFAGVSFQIQLLILVISVGLLAWGFGARPIAFVKDNDTKKSVFAGWYGIALVLVLLLGFAVRTTMLESSARVMVDEVNTIDEVLKLKWNPAIQVLTPMTGISPFPWLFAYMQYEGANIIGSNYIGLRIASSVVGLLTIAGTYLFTATIFDRKAALVAAFLLAVFPAHVHMSRLALLNIVDPLMGILALAFLARGFKRNRISDYALAGIFWGLTQYFYEGGRLFFIPLVATWIVFGFIFWRGHLRFQIKGMLITLFLALVIALPVYLTIAWNENALTGRLEATGVGVESLEALLQGDTETIEKFWRRLKIAFGFYLTTPEQSSAYLMGSQPLIMQPLIPFFFLGFFFMLWRFRTMAILIPMWIVSLLAANTLMLNPAGAPRFVLVMPVLALTVAIGIRYIVPILLPERFSFTVPRFRQVRWSAAAIICVLAIFAVYQVSYYFNQHLEEFNVQFRNTRSYPDPGDAAFRTLEFPSGTKVHLVAKYSLDINWFRSIMAYVSFDSQRSYPSQTYFAEDFTLEHLEEYWQEDADNAFFVERGQEEVIQLLYDNFDVYGPYVSWDTIYDQYDIPESKEYLLYYVPKEGSLPPACDGLNRCLASTNVLSEAEIGDEVTE